MLSHGYWLADEKNLDTAQKYEILGQRDDPKLIAIDATLDALDAIGEAEVERRAFAIGDQMRDMVLRLPGPLWQVGSAFWPKAQPRYHRWPLA